MIPFVIASFFVLFPLALSAGVPNNSSHCEVGTTFCVALLPPVCCRTSDGDQCCLTGFGGGRCCPSGSSCCGGTTCCSSGMCCGNECCPSGGTCCSNLCCLPGWTCCAGICCQFREICESGRCVLSEGSDKQQKDVEIKVEPSDPGIVYSGDWSSTGGTCTSGTRTTFQVKANFKYKFQGIKLTASFIPKDQTVNVSVESSGLTLDTFIIPAYASPQCREQDTWSRGFPFVGSSSDRDKKVVSFTFEGPVSSLAGSSLAGKRAPVALELAQIRYVEGTADGRITASASAVTLVTSTIVMLLTGIYLV